MKNIANKIKKDWKFFLLLGISIVLIVLMILYTLRVSDKVYNVSEKVEVQDTIKEVTAGMKFEQKINAIQNNFQRVDIQFEGFKEQSNIAGKVTIGIDDPNGKNIRKKTITRNYIRENSVYEFDFKNQSESANKEYTLWIQFEEVKEGSEFFTVKTANANQEDNKLIINGQEQNKKLAIQEFYKNSKKQAMFILGILIFIIYAVVISIYIYYQKEIKVEKIFLYTVPVICLFYIIFMPTFKNHDELYHWYRGYEVSMGRLMTGINGDILGTEMPENINKIATDDWTSITYTDVKECLRIPLESNKEKTLYAETSAVYSFVQYLPQGIGIAIARLFTDKVLLLAYAGRTMNMLVAMCCIYFAIKKIPFGKKILLLLSYIPISIEGFSSLSPDAMTISIAFIYIAYILNLAFSKEEKFIDKKQAIILTILSIIMSLCKIVYLPLVLLMFIIPKEKFKDSKKIKRIVVIIMIAVIINLVWLGISSIYLAHFREGDSGVQVKTLLLDPIKYIQECLYTLNINADSYIMTMFGQKLGWGELVNIHDIVPYVLFFMTIWITIIDETIKDRFKFFQKIIIMLSVVGIIGLIFTSLYVQWTTCGSDSIAGIQGRYFIPILPLVVLLVGSQIKINTPYNGKNVNKYIGIIGIIIQIIPIAQIIICHL